MDDRNKTPTIFNHPNALFQCKEVLHGCEIKLEMVKKLATAASHFQKFLDLCWLRAKHKIYDSSWGVRPICIFHGVRNVNRNGITGVWHLLSIWVTEICRFASAHGTLPIMQLPLRLAFASTFAKITIQSWRYKTIVVMKRQQQTTISNKQIKDYSPACSCCVIELQWAGAVAIHKIIFYKTSQQELYKSENLC